MSSKVFGSGIRRREDPRLLTGRRHVHRRLDAAQHGPRRHGAQSARARPDQAHRRQRAHAARRAWSPSTPPPTSIALQADAVRVAAAQRQPQDRRTIPASPATSSAMSATSSRWSSPRRRTRPTTRSISSTSTTSRCPRCSIRRRPSQPGAPQLHADVPNNIAFKWTVAGGDVDAAFAKAEVVVKERIVQQRLIPTAMEPRAAFAKWGGASGELTLWNTTQNPHILRFLTSVVDRHSRRQAAGDRAGSRWRVRQQDRRLSGRLPHGVLRA